MVISRNRNLILMKIKDVQLLQVEDVVQTTNMQENAIHWKRRILNSHENTLIQ